MTFLEAIRKRHPRAMAPAMLLLTGLLAQVALLTNSLWFAFISVPIGVAFGYLAVYFWRLPDDFNGDTK